MARTLRLFSLVAFLLFCLPVMRGQINRPPTPDRRPATRDPIGAMERQRDAQQQADRAKSIAIQKQRKEQLAELAKDIPRLTSLCQALQDRLKSTDLQNSLPSDLRKQSGELERLAHNINKKVRGL